MNATSTVASIVSLKKVRLERDSNPELLAILVELSGQLEEVVNL